MLAKIYSKMNFKLFFKLANIAEMEKAAQNNNSSDVQVENVDSVTLTSLKQSLTTVHVKAGEMVF